MLEFEFSVWIFYDKLKHGVCEQIKSVINLDQSEHP